MKEHVKERLCETDIRNHVISQHQNRTNMRQIKSSIVSAIVDHHVKQLS